MIFVYRLMFSGNGYTATLAATLGAMPCFRHSRVTQAEPIAASSMSAARAKVDEAIFKNLHVEILKRAEMHSQWKRHSVFSGRRLEDRLLPRPLLRAG